MKEKINEICNSVKNFFSKNVEKSETVSFVRENHNWYFDYPNYPFSKHDLLMINGSDNLLSILNMCSGNTDRVTVKISFCEEQPIYNPLNNKAILYRTHGSTTGGYFYNVRGVDFVTEAYFCPVMLFKYGYYPKYIVMEFPENYTGEFTFKDENPEDWNLLLDM